MGIEGPAIMIPDIGPKPDKKKTAEVSPDSGRDAQELEKEAYKQMVDKELSRIARANVDLATGRVSEEYLDKWLAYAELAALSDADDQRIREDLKPFYERIISENTIDSGQFDQWIKRLQGDFHSMEVHGWRQEDFDLVVEELKKSAEDWEVDRPSDERLVNVIATAEVSFRSWIKMKGYSQIAEVNDDDEMKEKEWQEEFDKREEFGAIELNKWLDWSKKENRTQLRREYPGWESEDAVYIYLDLKNKASAQGLEFAKAA